jgi:hypothetical protein
MKPNRSKTFKKISNKSISKYRAPSIDKQIIRELSKEYRKLDLAQKEALKNWIKENISSRSSENIHQASNWLKTCFERENFYITNGQFKFVMLISGFIPECFDALNWHWRINCKKS